MQSEIKNLTEFLQSKTLLLSPSKKKITKLTSNLPQKNTDTNFTNNFSISSSCLISPPNMYEICILIVGKLYLNIYQIYI